MRWLIRATSFVVLLTMLLAAVAACGGNSEGEGGVSSTAEPTSSTTIADSADGTPAVIGQEHGSSVGEDLTDVTVGYVPVLIFGPVMLAKDKGYFAEYGLDVSLEPLPGGADMVVLTANGDFDLGLGGAGPAYFNAAARGIALPIIAPAHFERDPHATPLMVSKKRYDSGELTSVEDLKGKTVSVNARGATEYWLDTALRSGGLTIEDVDLQALPFPDVPAALESGALDAAMLGEPLATMAEQQGIAVRLDAEMPVDFQPTFVWVNPEFAEQNDDLVTGFVAGMLRGCRDLWGEEWDSEENLAILNKYTNVPPELIKQSARTYCEPNGEIHEQDLATLQQFFADRGLLEYDEPLDVSTLIEPAYVNEAIEVVGPVAVE